MNSFLLNRQLGSITPQAFAKAQNHRLIRSFELDQDVYFAAHAEAINPRYRLAYVAGVNSICIDRFEGRYMISGGADSSISIWDLEATDTTNNKARHTPLASIARTSTTASLGITHVSFYPFDSMAFLTSGYDHTLKLASSETLKASASFELGSTVHSHATSDIASHLLVACATQHPAVRLIDLQSGASAHSLAGHSGSVLTVAWHPRNENILASGATDGTLRLWDIRRSASSVGVLNLDDSIGTPGFDHFGNLATTVSHREKGKAHIGAVNGITWTEDGHYLISTGLDEKMRVWDMTNGANTLANFGPALKNARNTTALPLLVPGHLSAAGSELILYPNPSEVLSFDLHNGAMVQRLRAATTKDVVDAGGSGIRNTHRLTTSLAWRSHHVEFYSSHKDGTVKRWKTQTQEDKIADEEMNVSSAAEEAAESKKRKHDELDQIVRDLTGKRVTYS